MGNLKKYLDKAGLKHYDSRLKEYMETHTITRIKITGAVDGGARQNIDVKGGELSFLIARMNFRLGTDHTDYSSTGTGVWKKGGKDGKVFYYDPMESGRTVQFVSDTIESGLGDDKFYELPGALDANGTKGALLQLIPGAVGVNAKTGTGGTPAIKLLINKEKLKTELCLDTVTHLTGTITIDTGESESEESINEKIDEELSKLTPTLGDIVCFKPVGREFIYSGNEWIELGDDDFKNSFKKITNDEIGGLFD